ncbi:MAG: rRNA pseudouridine synthase [Lachnospiraceae bacterium]|nr:rRNA pseudouridine synthase [Lachnospiraceae bacterium]
MSEEKIRINLYLAKAGICSRREADRLVEAGRVTVNGGQAVSGMKVGVSGDVVCVDGKPVLLQEKTVVYAFYKPAGVMCTHADPHADQTIFDLIETPERVSYAGRLDKESEGLLLLTNDGAMSRSMMHGAGGHEKEYLVQVDHPLTQDAVRKMEQGMYLKDLDRTTLPCRISDVQGGSFHIVLTQGLNRQIRRMCLSCGYQVKKLVRLRVMNVTVEGLGPGKIRKLTETEVETLKGMLDAEA